MYVKQFYDFIKELDNYCKFSNVLKRKHWRRLWGRKKISRAKFSNDVFWEKIQFFRPKFLTTFLFSHHQLYFVCLLSVTIFWNLIHNIYDPFLGTKFLTKNLDFRTKNSSLTPFFRQFVLCLTSESSTSQDIPHLKFCGAVPPVPSKSPPMGVNLISSLCPLLISIAPKSNT